jgi:uncharacterized OB-fold protein
MTTRPVADDLYVETDGLPVLVGSRCPHCATTTFPQQAGCPRCTLWEMAPHALPRTGTLWSFTVQGFEPKAPYRGPSAFTPYGVGYVDLGDVIVESRLTESDPTRLRIGMPVTLVLETLRTDDQGTDVLTFAFAPEGPPA